MFCTNCGADLSAGGNFCPYCGSRLENATVAGSLISKAASTMQNTNNYNLVLVSRGSCNAVTAGDLLEDVFGYTDAESGTLVGMAPVVVGENLTAEEASTIAQMYTEYGMEVSITNDKDQFVDLNDYAKTSVFDKYGNLMTGVAAVVGALTVANRIKSYRRFKKPSFLNRLFHLNYQPMVPEYHRNFRPRLNPMEAAPRKNVRRPAEPKPQMIKEPAMDRRGMGAAPMQDRRGMAQEPARKAEPRQGNSMQGRGGNTAPAQGSDRVRNSAPQENPGRNNKNGNPFNHR